MTTRAPPFSTTVLLDLYRGLGHLARHARRATRIVSLSDELALGVIAELTDDSPLATLAQPKLTAVRQRVREKGAAAARLEPVPCGSGARARAGQQDRPGRSGRHQAGRLRQKAGRCYELTW